VGTGQPQTPERRGVGAQFVGHYNFGANPSSWPAFVSTVRRPGRRGGAEPARRGLRPRGRQHAGDTFPSRRIRTIISSGCHRLLGRDGAAVVVARSSVRTSAPSSGRFRRRCRPTLSEENLDVPIAERSCRTDDGCLRIGRKPRVSTVANAGPTPRSFCRSRISASGDRRAASCDIESQ